MVLDDGPSVILTFQNRTIKFSHVIKMALLLAADIGGTKSDLAIFDLSQKPVDPPLRQKRYRNRDFLSFDEILTHFLTDTGTPEYGCFGFAAVFVGELPN